jgi:hypothetical protein
MDKAFGGIDVMWNDYLNHWMVDYDIIRVLKNCGFSSWAEVTTQQRELCFKDFSAKFKLPDWYIGQERYQTICLHSKLQDYVRVQGIRYSTKILYSKLKYYAEDENDVNRYMSTWTFNSMFKFKLQDYQYEEHYIPNWNFMPTKNIMINCFLVRNV